MFQRAKKNRSSRRSRRLRSPSRLQSEHLEDRRLMATYVVNSPADSGLGSLRDAVIQANSTPNVNDTITFANSLTGQKINLSSPISVTDDVVIDGQGRNITVDGNYQTRLFQVSSPSFTQNIDVTMKGLTLTRGKDVLAGPNSQAGGLLAGGADLTLDHMTFISNQAGHGAGATISQNSAGAAGGGVYWTGGNFNGPDRLRVLNSTIVQNSAADGGGIKQSYQGVATIDNSIVASIPPPPAPTFPAALRRPARTTSSAWVPGSPVFPPPTATCTASIRNWGCCCRTVDRPQRTSPPQPAPH